MAVPAPGFYRRDNRLGAMSFHFAINSLEPDELLFVICAKYDISLLG